MIIEIVNKMQESERAMSTNLPVLYGAYSVLGHLLEGKRAAAEVGDTRPLVWWPSLCQGGNTHIPVHSVPTGRFPGAGHHAALLFRTWPGSQCLKYQYRSRTIF